VKLVTPPPEPEFFSNEYEALQIITIHMFQTLVPGKKKGPITGKFN